MHVFWIILSIILIFELFLATTIGLVYGIVTIKRVGLFSALLCIICALPSFILGYILITGVKDGGFFDMMLSTQEKVQLLIITIFCAVGIYQMLKLFFKKK